MKNKFKNKNKKRKNIFTAKETLDINYNYIIILLSKLFFFFFIIFISFKSQSNKINELSKNNITQNYNNEFIEFTSKFSSNPFLNSFVKNISIISIDYSNKTQLDKNKIKIHICINLNNAHVYIALVAMESALSNMNKETSIYVYHILCANDTNNKNINIIRSLKNKYNDNLELIFYNMSNIFIQFEMQRLSQVAYYRLLLPLLIPYERAIYLDNDILVFKDLLELYQAAFNNNYVLGSLDLSDKKYHFLCKKSERFINSG